MPPCVFPPHKHKHRHHPPILHTYMDADKGVRRKSVESSIVHRTVGYQSNEPTGTLPVGIYVYALYIRIAYQNIRMWVSLESKGPLLFATKERRNVMTRQDTMSCSFRKWRRRREHVDSHPILVLKTSINQQCPVTTTKLERRAPARKCDWILIGLMFARWWTSSKLLLL